MKVLVTGASSLIGAGVARALAARGDRVVCFQRTSADDLTRSVRPGPVPARTEPDDRSIDQHLGDVRDLDALTAAAAGCDAVIHLAAKVGVVGPWEDYRSINVDGTANVLEAARTVGSRRVVHVSSPSVAHGGEALVGAGAEAPVTGRKRAHYAEIEGARGDPRPRSATDEMGVVAIRPHLVWGPGDTQLVGRIVDRARSGRLALVGGGRALVDTTYVDNAVGALLAAVDAVAPEAPCSGRAYVIANGEPRPIRDLVAGICAAAGVEFAPRDVPLAVGTRVGAVVERLWPLLRRDDEPPLTRFLAEQLGTAHWFDPQPAARDLGWAPTVSIDEGLGRLADWYAAERPIAHPPIDGAARYPRRATATWQSGSCNGLQSRVPGFNSRRRLRNTWSRPPGGRGHVVIGVGQISTLAAVIADAVYDPA